MLLLHAGRTVPKHNLIAYAWGGDPPATADDLVAAYLSRLRRALAPLGDGLRLLSMRPGFRAEIDPDQVVLDVQRFNELVRLANREREAFDDEQAAMHLRQALDCWHGNTTALIDLDADWLRRQADVLAQHRLDALGMLAEISLGAGRPDESVALLRDAALLHPGRETLAVTLVQALTATGESVQAAQIAARAAKALIDLGQEPGPALRQAQRAALTHRTNSPPPRNGGGRFQLPADTRVFTGRTTELNKLLGLLLPPPDPGPTPSEVTPPASAPSQAGLGLIAIDGMAGIGKSALAVHLAHRLAERFPDGHLFADLHGYTRGYPPRAPADVLDGFLRALGVMPEYVPEDLEQSAALYRSRLRGTRTLILLDNARSESQVRPLLPSTPECLVLITSRRRLKGLDDAHSLSLELMPTADAVSLFRTVAGPGQIPAGDPALDEIINLCARLPLALRIAAALLRHRPAWRLDHLAGLLRGQRDRLAALSDGERDLSAVFDLSYDALTGGTQQLYHRLGVHPGPDIDGYAAAAMIADDAAAASRGLEELVDHNLLSEPVPGRYRFHDLIRAHAQERAVRLGCNSPTPDPSPFTSPSAPQPSPTPRSLDLVRTRLFDYYLSTAQAADRHLARRTTRYSIPIAYPPRERPALETRGQAAEWMRTELPNLAAYVEEALKQSKSEYVVALSAALHGYLYIEGPWSYALNLHAKAAEAAESIGDAYGQATALHSLGRVRRQVGDYIAGEQAQRRSLALYRQIGHAQGEANALDGLGRIFLLTGNYSSAVEAFDLALALLQQLGDLLGQAGALNGLGRVRRLLGDPAGAVEAHRRALDLCRTADDPISQATALNDLGRAHEQIGDLISADSAQQQALKLYLDTGHQLGQANVLRDQGRILRRAGKPGEAARAQERALELYTLLGHRLGQADTLKELGLLRQQASDTRAATAAYRRALALFREMRDRRGEAETLNRHASALVAAATSSAAVTYGDTRACDELTRQARSLYAQALNLARAIDAPVEEADAHEGIGETYASEAGGTSAAAESLNEALAIRRRLGLPSDHLVSRIEQLARG